LAAQIYEGGPNWKIRTIKLNSAGTVQWRRRLNNGSNSGVSGIAVDSSGNVFGSGNLSDSSSAGTARAGVWKYNSSGTLQWKKVFGSGEATDITVDSSGNVYFVTSNISVSEASRVARLVKLDTSGNILWQRQLSDATFGSTARGVKVDSSGVYMVGHSNGKGLLAKYNDSGTIQWQRTITGGELYDLALGTDNVFVTGYGYGTTSAADRHVIHNFPKSGTKIGTYTLSGHGSITYAAGSFTDSAGSLSGSDAADFSDGADTFSFATGSYTTGSVTTYAPSKLDI
jgi:hypothetical protein